MTAASATQTAQTRQTAAVPANASPTEDQSTEISLVRFFYKDIFVLN